MGLRALSSRCFFCGLAFLIAGCESSKLPVEGKDAEEVFREALIMLKDENFEDASTKFKDVDTYFPYSKKANEAQILSAYCNFKKGSYLDAIRELDIFLRYHPSHQMVPYALYLRAVNKYMTISTVGRDSERAKETRGAFIELINRFPESKYAKDSRKKIIILDDVIAAHELLIGKYYQKRKSSLSAINRYNYIVSRFSNTKSAEEAFFRIVECCKNEGLQEEANNAASVLKIRFPNSKWTKKLARLQ